MNSIDTIFEHMKNDVYADKYIDRFDMLVDPVNPLLQIVPSLTEPIFFGTKVCNIVCFTQLLDSFDDGSVSEAVERLISNFSRFANYETHIFIDGSSDDITDSDPTDLENNINDMLSTYNLGSYGFTYWGILDGASLQHRIEIILANFYGA